MYFFTAVCTYCKNITENTYKKMTNNKLCLNFKTISKNKRKLMSLT